jgi:hypothetical protein
MLHATNDLLQAGRERQIPEAGIEPAAPLREAVFKTADFANLSTRADTRHLRPGFGGWNHEMGAGTLEPSPLKAWALKR